MGKEKLLVFSDDWGRHPSSCQHLVQAMLPDTYVVWVNTIGMRPPRLDLLTLRRGAGKLAGWLQIDRFRRQEEAGSGLASRRGAQPTIIDAKMWPWMTRPHDRWLNRKLLTRQLIDAAHGATVVTTIPIIADLVGRLPAKRWVYYCVDDFSMWPGLDQDVMLPMERRLVERVDRVIAASDVLQERIMGMGRDAYLLTHGVDVEHWSPVAAGGFDWPARVQPPVLLFWGVVDRRLDAEWMVALSQRYPEWSIVLVGPHQDPDSSVIELPNVHCLGAVDIGVLPSMAHSADCLIMPYVDAAVTRAMQPLKLKEYLATAKPVVARRLPAIEPWADCLSVATDVREFGNAVHQALHNGLTEQQAAARGRLASESWAAKAVAFSRMLGGSIPHEPLPYCSNQTS